MQLCLNKVAGMIQITGIAKEKTKEEDQVGREVEVEKDKIDMVDTIRIKDIRIAVIRELKADLDLEVTRDKGIIIITRVVDIIRDTVVIEIKATEEDITNNLSNSNNIDINKAAIIIIFN
jgi:exosome complex RNA-binding protein Csl4